MKDTLSELKSKVIQFKLKQILTATEFDLSEN